MVSLRHGRFRAFVTTQDSNLNRFQILGNFAGCQLLHNGCKDRRPSQKLLETLLFLKLYSLGSLVR
ncbi:hypothetical protein PsorP6_012516 [Peronosclerospora sorghi]|uniref:Uncharacterized protein n=1 Tax=Peronosclerospora sorghi TaxID=230839 RepID=A0ACC0WH59_9STRA|nr:hypothetical protein PsorP6_012516 [Peronosclerospora sorghi]